MIDTLGKLSVRCARYRHLLWVIAGVFTALFVYSLFDHAPGRIDFLVPGVVGITWCLTFYAFAGLFNRVPPRASPKAGLVRGAGRRLHRFLLYLLGASFIGLTLTVSYLTIKMLAIWVGELPGD